MPSKKQAKAGFRGRRSGQQSQKQPVHPATDRGSEAAPGDAQRRSSRASAPTRGSRTARPPHKALLEDKKLRADLQDAAVAIREASARLTEPPKPKRKRRLGRRLLILFAGAALALALSEEPPLQGARHAVRRRGGVPVHAAGGNGHDASGDAGHRRLARRGNALRVRAPRLRGAFAFKDARSGAPEAAVARLESRPMEAAAVPQLPSDKAARIVEAMRASVAARGIAGSTFDHVAREAGVSRGLLHYYFGTKERLVVEVVRRECQVRGELLQQAVAGCRRSRRADRRARAELRGGARRGLERGRHVLRAADARAAQ